MSPEISERAFEEAIECALLEHGPWPCATGDATMARERQPPYGDAPPGGYRRRKPEDYDRECCLLALAVGLVVLAMASCSAWLAVGAAPWVQSSGAPAREATGFLLGQVVDATTGNGVAGATVSISGGSQSRSPQPNAAPRQLLTGADGQFLFRALASGRYQINVTAPGYLAGRYGQVRPFGSEQVIELAGDDEKHGDVKIRLWKQASISGRIVDEDGEPVAGCLIRYFRRTLVNGKPRFALYGGVNDGYTDDRGVYRIAELMPGEYLVGVMSTQATMLASTAAAYLEASTSGNGTNSSELGRELGNSGAPQQGLWRHRVGEFVFQSSGAFGQNDLNAPPPAADGKILTYPAVFYPAASLASQASLVTLAAGEVRIGIDLQLKLTPTVRVSGIVTGPDGPVRNLGVRLLPSDAGEFSAEDRLEIASTATDANGAFTFLGVPPGQYALKSLRVPKPGSYGPSDPAPPLPSGSTLWGSMSINVGNTDVAGLAVALSPGSQISGRIVFEGTSPPPAASQMSRLLIEITPFSGIRVNAVNGAYKRVEPDGRFVTVGLPPGRYAVNARLVAGGTPWQFKSATLAGRDVSDEGLLVEGTDVAGLVLTFTDRATDVSGTVTDSQGRPDSTASVVVIPADSQAWKQGAFNARRLRSIRTATTGSFSLTDLPAGSYFIAAISDEALENWQDPKKLDAITRVAARFTLADGGRVVQNLTTRSIR